MPIDDRRVWWTENCLSMFSFLLYAYMWSHWLTDPSLNILHIVAKAPERVLKWRCIFSPHSLFLISVTAVALHSYLSEVKVEKASFREPKVGMRMHHCIPLWRRQWRWRNQWAHEAFCVRPIKSTVIGIRRWTVPMWMKSYRHYTTLSWPFYPKCLQIFTGYWLQSLEAMWG